jgi:hypothetical protein
MSDINFVLDVEDARMLRDILQIEATGYILSPSHEAESSVEGRLEILTTHNGSKFVVYDVIDNRSVSCEIPIEYLDIAHRNFNKRVEVIGVVKFRKDGMPVSVKASKIIPFPNSEEIPSLERMRWLLNGGAIA